MAVVVGFDPHFNYLKIAKSMQYLANPNCQFLATNTDRTYPDTHHVLPAAGTMVTAIRAATGREPLVIGKPSRLAYDTIQFIDPEIPAERTLMVGDKIATDIAFGCNCGMKTLLVETGVDKEADLKDYGPDLQPNFVASSIADLLPLSTSCNLEHCYDKLN